MTDHPIPDDLVARLRRMHHHRIIPDEPSLYGEAADRIEELTAECRDLTTRAEAAEEAHSEALAENERLRKALDRITKETGDE